MEYVAIAFDEKLEDDFQDSLVISAKKYGIELKSDNNFEIDSEVTSGLMSFCEWSNISNVFFFNYRSENDAPGISSSGISQDLREFNFREKKDSILLNFINEPIIANASYYLIFAYEWHEEDLIRFITTSLKGVEKYFRENVSWYLWLYTYRGEEPCYIFDLDVPLVLKVNRE